MFELRKNKSKGYLINIDYINFGRMWRGPESIGILAGFIVFLFMMAYVVLSTVFHVLENNVGIMVVGSLVVFIFVFVKFAPSEDFRLAKKIWKKNVGVLSESEKQFLRQLLKSDPCAIDYEVKINSSQKEIVDSLLSFHILVEHYRKERRGEYYVLAHWARDYLKGIWFPEQENEVV